MPTPSLASDHFAKVRFVVLLRALNPKDLKIRCITLRHKLISTMYLYFHQHSSNVNNAVTLILSLKAEIVKLNCYYLSI